jgi:hypothetical protein
MSTKTSLISQLLRAKYMQLTRVIDIKGPYVLLCNVYIYIHARVMFCILCSDEIHKIPTILCADFYCYTKVFATSVAN